MIYSFKQTILWRYQSLIPSLSQTIVILFVIQLIFFIYQGEWDKLAGSVKEREKEIDDKEVLSIKVFLKQLANEFYDMELLAKSINDPVKQKESKEIAKQFRQEIRECDDAAGNGNIAKIIELYPKTATELKDFFGLMQDVPDEI